VRATAHVAASLLPLLAGVPGGAGVVASLSVARGAFSSPVPTVLLLGGAPGEAGAQIKVLTHT
jgi:hypothetical protein